MYVQRPPLGIERKERMTRQSLEITYCQKGVKYQVADEEVDDLGVVGPAIHVREPQQAVEETSRQSSHSHPALKEKNKTPYNSISCVCPINSLFQIVDCKGVMRVG